MYRFDIEDIKALKLFNTTDYGKAFVERIETYLTSTRSTDVSVSDGSFLMFNLAAQNAENRLLQQIISVIKKDINQ